jgi:hypothetical protein
MIVYTMSKPVNRTEVLWERDGRMVVNIVVDDLVDSEWELHEEWIINKLEKSMERKLINVSLMWGATKN